MEKLIKIAAGIDQFTPLFASFTGQDPMNQQQQQHQTVSCPSSLVIGRDREQDSLVNMLISAANMPSTSSERRIPVLAIYGIGGAGKTTLAQSIYNDSRVVEHFKTKMWVHVSRKFDALTITKKIIESIKQGKCPRMENLDALQSILKDKLRSKRFFLVLDDVWCLDKEQYMWDQMLIPFNEVGDMGSRILITCRAEKVTSILGVNLSFPLSELQNNDYWSIFMHYSFGDAKKDINDPQLLEVGREIVKKLSKSPLAARMVGNCLRRKQTVEYWKQTLQKGDMLKETLGALYWSFEQLPPYLQICFALCSLYPKGYRFRKEDFARLWIAEGFVEISSNSTITVEDEAMRYFNELLSNSFFQQYNGFRGKAYYGMHDLLHDLAGKVSEDYCFRIEDDCKCIPSNVMHLSVVSKDISSHIPDIFKLVNLRTFIIVSSFDNDPCKVHLNDLFGFTKKVFMKFEKLRVLHLGYSGVLKLDKSVRRLKHLRSFQTGKVNKLPKSLGELYHLQFLVFWGSVNDKVPQNLNNLINLRYMHGDNVTIKKIPLFGKLRSLQEIEPYQASRRKKFGIGQLKNLQQLRGSLCIYNLENVKDKAEASEVLLKEKKHVDRLELQWEQSSERDGRMDKEVLQGLQPPPNLHELVLDGYNGVEFPKWTRNDGSLSDLHFLDLERLYSLEIVNCQNLLQVSSLPRMLGRLVIRGCPNVVLSQSHFLHNLKELDLEECGGVETMLSNLSLCNSENDSIQERFVLERLRIVKCSIHSEKELYPDKLTSLSHLTFTELPWLTSLLLGPNLTSLKYVEIESCENLRSIGNSFLPSLESLYITNCPRLTVQRQQPDNSGGTIECLSVAGCPELTSLGNTNFFTTLRFLRIIGCPKLTIKSGDLLFIALPRRECLNSLSTISLTSSPRKPSSIRKLLWWAMASFLQLRVPSMGL